MNDIFFKDSKLNIKSIKSKLDNLKLNDNEKDFILLVATHDYLKYIYNFLDSFYKTNISSQSIFIFTIQKKKGLNKNILDLKSKFDFYHFEIILNDRGAKYIKEISANLRLFLINLLIPYSKSVLYLDSDSIILKDLKKMYNSFSNYSVALKKHPEHRNGKLNHYYPIKSGLIYVKNNRFGRNFVKYALSDIKKNLNIWYADQKAISYAYFKVDFSQISKVLLFKSEFFDWNFYPEPYIFSAKGIRKNTFFFIYFSQINKYTNINLVKQVCFILIVFENLMRNLFKNFHKLLRKILIAK